LLAEEPTVHDAQVAAGGDAPVAAQVDMAVGGDAVAHADMAVGNDWDEVRAAASA
jgi:hypothetical protein